MILNSLNLLTFLIIQYTFLTEGQRLREADVCFYIWHPQSNYKDSTNANDIENDTECTVLDE